MYICVAIKINKNILRYHLCYNTTTNESRSIYRLPYPNGLMYHGLLHCKSQSTLLSNAYIFESCFLYASTNKSRLLFGGVFYNNATASIQYSSDFWTFNLLNNNWNKIPSKKLPKQMSGFGYLLYNDRILLLFGGKVADEKPADNIYYLDILTAQSKWKEAKIKCPLKGGYHAILEQNAAQNVCDKVHLFSASPMKEHFVIDIDKLLPVSIMSLPKARCDNFNTVNHLNGMNVSSPGSSSPHIMMTSNQHQKQQYNSIWIDKSKLSAKSRIECTPFYLDCRNTIIYSAEYNLHDDNQGGIYAYDNVLDKHTMIEKFEEHQYYPSGHTSIYNAPTEEIIFIGGKNVKNNRKPYEIMMIYDMNDHSMTKVLFKRAIGSDPKLLLIEDDLHIVGGSHNTLRQIHIFA